MSKPLAAALALLAVTACASAPGPRGKAGGLGLAEAARGAAACPSRGGTLAVLDGRGGTPVSCATVRVVAGETTYAGATDASGLLLLELEPGARIRVAAEGWDEQDAVVAAPFGDATPVIELWRGEKTPSLRVLAEDGVALRGVAVTLVRGGEAVYEGQTNAVGALYDVPADLTGLSAQAAGFEAAPVDASSRQVALGLPAPRE